MMPSLYRGSVRALLSVVALYLSGPLSATIFVAARCFRVRAVTRQNSCASADQRLSRTYQNLVGAYLACQGTGSDTVDTTLLDVFKEIKLDTNAAMCCPGGLLKSQRTMS